MSESKKEKKTKSEKKEKAEDQVSSNRHDNTARQGTHKETTSATNSDSQKPEAGNVDADIASGKKDKKTKKHSADAAGEMKGTRGLRALVIGGTGEIGRHLVNHLVKSSKFAKVTSIQRRVADFHPKDDKLHQAIVGNFEDLQKPEYAHHFEDIDVAFNTFGTTRSDAGGAEAFRKIDYGYAVKFGQACADHGVKHMHLVTSTGADANSFFLYMEVKGKIEEYYKSLKFDDLSIYRPGFLDRENKRFGEKLAALFVKGIPVSDVAKSLQLRAEFLAENPVAAGDVSVFDNKAMNKIIHDAATAAPSANL